MDRFWLDSTIFDAWSEFTDQVDNAHRKYTKHNHEAGYIYIAELVGSNEDLAQHLSKSAMVKIGLSRFPDQRIRQLNSFNTKMPIRIHKRHAFWAFDTRQVEKYLHEYFKDYRVDGEWFRLSTDLLQDLYVIWFCDGDSGEIEFHDIMGQIGSLDDLLSAWKQVRTEWAAQQ